MIKMNKLPLEMIQMILRKLDVNDLLRLSLVNHKMYSIINDYFKIRCLSVTDAYRCFTKMNFTFTFDLIENKYYFFTENVNFLQAKIMRSLLSDLKQLYIDLPYPHFCTENPMFSFVNDLNQFTGLEQLQIQVLVIKKTGGLKLPNLKILSISRFRSNGNKLKLFTPKLTTFKTGNALKLFDFMYEDKLISLSTDEYTPDVDKFVNLEYYYCKYLSKREESYELPNEILDKLKSLKELHTYSRARKDTVTRILSSKNKLRRLDFNFYYGGLRIESINDINNYAITNSVFLFDINSNINMFLVYYTKLAQQCPYVTEIDYSALIAFCDGKFKDDFLDRFMNIKRIEISDVIKNADQLIQFIKRCRNLKWLKLENASLDQVTFYDQLHRYQPNLTNLRIKEKQELNLNFILNFKHLNTFSTDQQVPFALIQQAFYDLISFEKFQFKIKKKEIELYSSSPDNAYTRNSLTISYESVFFQCKRRLLDFLSKMLDCCYNNE